MTPPDRARSRGSRRAAASFYAAALNAADRDALDGARGVEGLADEIALLRLRLRDALVDHADDARLIEASVRLLIQSLLAQHRVSAKQADNLSEAIAAVLEEFGAVLKGVTDDPAA